MFHLWAPSATTIELCHYPGHEEVLQPMRPIQAGWFELTLPDARAGDRYRYRIDGELRVPDPASRFQPEDVHGSSLVIDPTDFSWQDGEWTGRPWSEAVIYELHVGSFSPEGTFAGVEQRLDHLLRLGVTAIELMPVSDFPGRRNWGYDGVLPFAPDSQYGQPHDLKALVQAAHHRGLMIFLDVVYNHFGPEGNYLHRYARPFFTERHHTPWGAAINFDGQDSRPVRDFFIHNALYWLEEYHFDGLRLDAVHAICDDNHPDILEELAETVRRGPGRDREIHLVLENDNNAARYLRGNTARSGYDAQWNDDLHHALHVLITGETDGYYLDFADSPLDQLGRCLTEGFAYQGDPSRYRDGAVRGETSTHLPPLAFVGFLQNHDQIGNRAFGDRLTASVSEAALRAATAILLLAPSPPLLFMGQEWATRRPFPFFCDFHGELATAVTAGRRREFARFPQFRSQQVRDRIPDPNAIATFESAALDWDELQVPGHRAWMMWHSDLLSRRRQLLIPCLTGLLTAQARWRHLGGHALRVEWPLSDGRSLLLLANLGDDPCRSIPVPREPALYSTHGLEPGTEELPGWAVHWVLGNLDGTRR